MQTCESSEEDGDGDDVDVETRFVFSSLHGGSGRGGVDVGSKEDISLLRMGKLTKDGGGKKGFMIGVDGNNEVVELITEVSLSQS